MTGAFCLTSNTNGYSVCIFHISNCWLTLSEPPLCPSLGAPLHLGNAAHTRSSPWGGADSPDPNVEL
eukprot:4634689-Prymnesium_polylepis.1